MRATDYSLAITCEEIDIRIKHAAVRWGLLDDSVGDLTDFAHAMNGLVGNIQHLKSKEDALIATYEAEKVELVVLRAKLREA